MKSTLVKVFGIVMILGLILSALAPIIFLFGPSIGVPSETTIDPPAPVEVEP